MPRRGKARRALAGLAATLVVGLVAVGSTEARAGANDAALSLTFEGRVEPMRTVMVANRVDGVIDEVLFDGGEAVQPGDPLFVIDPSEHQIAVDSARAAVALAEARLRLAEDAAERTVKLVERGTGASVSAFETRIGAEIARAGVDEARATLTAAMLDVERTRVAAPIAGHVGRPLVARGAFVEAEAGTALAEIVQLDPVLVGYSVPYETRMEALEASGAADVPTLFEQVTVALELPNGQRYPHAGTPRFESARIDPETGMMTTWAVFPNPDRVLVPGLEVRVHSSVARAEAAR